MERTAPKNVTWEQGPVGRLLLVGAVAAALSASANAFVLPIASSLLGAVVIPPDEKVTFGQVAGASAAGAVGAVVIFAVISRFTRRPIRIILGVAAAGLLILFMPIALSGATGSSAGTLALMHVVTAATNVGLLMALDRKRYMAP